MSNGAAHYDSPARVHNWSKLPSFQMEAVSDLIFTSERHLAAEAANLPVDIAKARVSE